MPWLGRSPPIGPSPLSRSKSATGPSCSRQTSRSSFCEGLGVFADARYDRQTRLFGMAGQERIGDFKVAIVGLGGVGSHVAQQLAYLGTKRFILIDADIVT